MERPNLVSNNPGDAVGLSQLIAPAPDLIQRPSGSLMEMVPQLAVWPVSGKDTLVAAFQRRPQNFCSNPGESNQVSPMTHTFRSGLAGVLSERGRNPISGPASDIANFLTELHQ